MIYKSRYSRFSFRGLFLFLLCCSLQLNCLSSTLKKESELSVDIIKKSSFHGPVSDSIGFPKVKSAIFSPVPSPNFIDEYGVYWMKLEVQSDISQLVVYDYDRNDYIDIYYEDLGKVIHNRSGILRPASQRHMGRWNTSTQQLIAGKKYTIYVRIENTHNIIDFDIDVKNQLPWVKAMSNKLFKDIAFLSIIGILALYNFLIYAFGKKIGYLYLSIYLLSIFLFFAFLSGILIDYVMPEHPQYTFVFLSFILFAIVYYYKFIIEFLVTKKLQSKWKSKFNLLSNINLFLFFGLILSFIFINHIPVIAKAIQFMLLGNILILFIANYFLYINRDEFTIYLILGTVFMLIFSTTDAIIWNYTNGVLGEYSKVGFILETVFFSIGLGKKFKKASENQQESQLSYINLLETTERLVDNKKRELKEQVKSRTIELEIAKDKAEKATKIKSDFLSVMSHEIRTPLNAVVGTIHLLVDENPRADQKKYLNTLKFSAKNLITLMNDILDYSKLESGNLKLDLTSINVKEIAIGIKEVYYNEAISKGIQFEISIDKSIPNFLLGDPGRLIQVLNNLVGNAIKFTNDGSVSFDISLVDKKPSSVVLKFQIADTGIGISKNKQKIIFDSFTQAETDTTRHFGGTGLGLSIVKRLIHLFETEIYLESEEGKGSKFYFELELPIDHSEQPDHKVKQKEDLLRINTFKGKRILVVDDNSVNLMMVKGFLRNWKIESITALSGKQALIDIKANPFDLVLLDLRMPEMDGYQVAREIRSMNKDFSVDKLPIIALSANAFSEVEKDILDAGMNDYISKPFDPDKLMNIIHKYLN